LNAFNSYPFINFLEELTGIPKLLPDPHFNGGGLHQILNGGKLAIHTDFNQLASLDLYRRLNVLLYLNENWKDEYNGNLELWDQTCSSCVKSVAPTFNKLVVFETNKRSFHGHPKPLNTPGSVTRKSIAL
jgi:Rps23 Pro-64 3,4-dihydroxylase Tpa1-like proline 4-hydroxylase